MSEVLIGNGFKSS